jgi:hypothetical protein
MGPLAAQVPPEPLDGVEPGPIGGEIEQNQSSGGPTHDRFPCIVCLRAGIVPRDVDRLLGVLGTQRMKPCRDLSAPFMAPDAPPRLPRMVVNGPDALGLRGLPRRRHHDLLPFGAPHGPARWHPGESELVRSVKDLPRLQAITGRFARLFFP